MGKAPYTLEEENAIYHLINNEYAKEVGEFVDIQKEADRDLLYIWARENSRFDTLNYLIDRCIKSVMYEENEEDADLFSKNNLNELLKLMLEQAAICLSNKNADIIPVSKVTKDEIGGLVREILTLIDPSLDWLNIYEDAKTNKKIIYLNECTEEEKHLLSTKWGDEILKLENCCITLNGETVVFLTYNGNIMDVCYTLHEFAHFISKIKSNNQKASRNIVEFSSIFYELFTLLVLYKKGYSIKELYSINSLRLLSTLTCCFAHNDIFNYMRTYLQEGAITEKKEIERIDRANQLTLNVIDEAFKKDIEKNCPDFWDSKKSARNTCDKTIKNLILHQEELYKAYPYIIGNYLALTAINNFELDPGMLSKMKYYTEEAASIDPYEIFEGIGCDVSNLKRSTNLDEGAPKM